MRLFGMLKKKIHLKTKLLFLILIVCIIGEESMHDPITKRIYGKFLNVQKVLSIKISLVIDVQLVKSSIESVYLTQGEPSLLLQGSDLLFFQIKLERVRVSHLYHIKSLVVVFLILRNKH